MYRLILLLILCSFAITACRKSGPLFDGVTCSGDCLLLQGRLVEQQTGNGLGGTELKFYYKHPRGLLFSGKTDYLGVTTTQTDGSYSFRFDARLDIKGNTIRIEGQREGYTNRSANKDNILANVEMDSINTPIIRDLMLWKAAPLKVRVMTSSTTNFNSFSFTQKCGNILNYDNSVAGNRSFDVTFDVVTGSDMKTYISWSTYGNTILRGIDSIIVPHNTTGTVTIKL